MNKQMLEKKKSVVILSIIGMLWLLGNCQQNRIRSDDAMRIVKSDLGYRVTLEGKDCMIFFPPELKGCGPPQTEISDVEGGWQKVRMIWTVSSDIVQDELSVRIDLGFEPDFWWAPHLAPYEGYVIAQHVFRSPALIVQQASLTLVIIPDLDEVGKLPENPWFMDYDAIKKKMWLGLVKTEIPEHVLFKKVPGMKFNPVGLKIRTSKRVKMPFERRLKPPTNSAKLMRRRPRRKRPARPSWRP